MPGRPGGRRGIVLEGHLRFENGGAAFDVTGDGAELRVETHGLREVRWTPRLALSALALYVRLSRRLRRAGMRLKFVRSGKKRT